KSASSPRPGGGFGPDLPLRGGRFREVVPQRPGALGRGAVIQVTSVSRDPRADPPPCSTRTLWPEGCLQTSFSTGASLSKLDTRTITRTPARCSQPWVV